MMEEEAVEAVEGCEEETEEEAHHEEHIVSALFQVTMLLDNWKIWVAAADNKVNTGLLLLLLSVEAAAWLL